MKFLLRLPGDLHRALAKAAAESERSLHGQIVYLLKKGLEEDKKETGEA